MHATYHCEKEENCKYLCVLLVFVAVVKTFGLQQSFNLNPKKTLVRILKSRLQLMLLELIYQITILEYKSI